MWHVDMILWFKMVALLVALDYTRIRLVAEKTHFHESNGTISDAIYIELDREIEPNITVQLSQSTSKLWLIFWNQFI